MKILKKFYFLSFLISFPLFAFALPSGNEVIISEVEYDPSHSGGDQAYEWFELYNPTAHGIDISNYQVSDGEGTITIPSGTQIDPGEYFLAVFRTSSFQTEHANINPDLEYGNFSGASSLNFGNSGDELILMNASGTTIDFVSWENHTSGWNVRASAGESIARATSTDTDSVSDWLSHQTPSPGTGNLSLINDAPAIDAPNNGSDGTLTIQENESRVTTIHASDPNTGDTIHYYIVGGSDQNFFSLDENTGELNFVNAPDYENPADANRDNEYELSVEATDGFLNDTQNLIIRVLDVAEQNSQGNSNTDDVKRKKGRRKRLSRAEIRRIFAPLYTFSSQKEKEEKKNINYTQDKKEEKGKVCTELSFVRVLRIGSRGNDVKKVQSCLHSLGYYRSTIDGIFGLKTKFALLRFQRENRLKWVDGIFGRESFRYLSSFRGK